MTFLELRESRQKTLNITLPVIFLKFACFFMDNKAVGLFLIGIAVGSLLPKLPEPISLANPFVPFVLIALAIVFFVKQ